MPCSSSTALVNFAQVNAGWNTYKDKHRKCSLLHQWQSEKVIANLSHLFFGSLCPNYTGTLFRNIEQIFTE